MARPAGQRCEVKETNSARAGTLAVPLGGSGGGGHGHVWWGSALGEPQRVRADTEVPASPPPQRRPPREGPGGGPAVPSAGCNNQDYVNSPHQHHFLGRGDDIAAVDGEGVPPELSRQPGSGDEPCEKCNEHVGCRFDGCASFVPHTNGRGTT